MSAPIHAPTSGTRGRDRPAGRSPSVGPDDACITIETDGEDAWADLPAMTDRLVSFRRPARAHPLGRHRRTRRCGLPTAVKVQHQRPAPDRHLIINAAECEPTSPATTALMRDGRPVVDGIGILRHLVGARQCLIGIEDNKPRPPLRARRCPPKGDTGPSRRPNALPEWWRKQLIRLLTGREVPSHDCLRRSACCARTSPPAVAVADAVLRGRPLIERVVTVTGRGVASRASFRVAIGSAAIS